MTGGHESLGAAGHWLVATLYSSQIFSDFAGYTFMAIGISKLLGYVLPQNFNAPYIATTFQSFWRRWHITLSLFLRDYLYIYSLGGNRVGKLRSYLNVMITMLLGGLWHGASWNFVIWGGIHGSALAVEKVAGMEEPRPVPVRALWWLIVQVTVVIAWVFFRSPTLYGAASFVRSMFLPAQGGSHPQLLYATVFMIPMIGHHVARIPAFNTEWMAHWAPQGIITGVTGTLAILFYGYPAAFIYFNF